MKFSSLLRRLVAIALLGSTLLASQSFAGVIYQQLPNTILTGIQADASTGPYPESPSITSGPAHIQSISWWGYYGPGSDPSTDSFLVALNGANVAGTVSSSAAGDDLTKYDFVVADMNGFAYNGGALLLELVNDSYFVDWRWQGALGAGDEGLRALQINGSLDAQNTVPEPNTLILAGLALGMLAAAHRQAARRADPKAEA